MFKICICFLILFVGASAKSKNQISCIGKTGKKVDWFVVYKMPKVKVSKPKHIRKGLGMVYMDSRSPRWRILPQSVEDYNQPLAFTLEQMYSRVKSKQLDGLAYVLYNDRTFKKKMSSSKGHAKGTVFFDRKSGFWLSHSVPAFPPPPTSHRYDYPSSGNKYAQIFLCVSVATKNLDKISTYLQFINPQMYSRHIDRAYRKTHPKTWNLIKNSKKVLKRSRLYTSTQRLQTLARNEFLIFAKSKHFGKDLYDGLVAPTLHTNLLTETWLNGNGDYESVCTRNYSVKNILKVEVMKMDFINSQDHAKWSVSDDVGQLSSSSKPILEEIIINREVLDLKFQKNLKSSFIRNVKKYGYNSLATNTTKLSYDKTGIMENFSPLALADNVYLGRNQHTTKKAVVTKKRRTSSKKKKKKKRIIGEVDGFKVRENAGWVCVGDINRQRSQSKRGGGSLCFTNVRAWKSFHDMVVSVEGCNNKEIFI